MWPSFIVLSTALVDGILSQKLNEVMITYGEGDREQSEIR